MAVTPIELDTERLRLRQWSERDFAAVAAINADPAVMEHFPEPLSREASDQLTEKVRADIGRRGWGFWAVEQRASGRIIGFTGLNVPSAALPFSPCVEIAWRFSAAYWGHGYASEAARAALYVAFERLALTEVVSFTTRRNERSRRLMERLGMEYVRDFDHPGVTDGSPLKPHALYRLRRTQWASLGVPFPVPHERA